MQHTIALVDVIRPSEKQFKMLFVAGMLFPKSSAVIISMGLSAHIPFNVKLAF